MFPARAKRKMERVYTSIDRIIKIADQFSRKCLLLSVIFTQFLIIYSWSLLFVVDSWFPSARFFVRWNRKKTRKKWREKSGARTSRIYFPIYYRLSKIRSTLKAAARFQGIQGSRVSERRDEFSRLHSSSTCCFATLRRAEWEFEMNMKAGRTPPSLFFPFLVQRVALYPFPRRYLSTNVANFSQCPETNSVQKRFDYIIKLSCKSM